MGPSLRLMLSAVRTELKAMSAILVALLVVCYIYGVAAWIIFGDGHLAHGGIEFVQIDNSMLPLDTYLNFNDLITSLCKMIVLSTGSEWSETMLLAKSEIYKPQGVSVD